MDVSGLCKEHAWVEVDQGNVAVRAFPKMMDYMLTHNGIGFTLTSFPCYSS